MATANPKIILSRPQDIPFNKLVLSQANARRASRSKTSPRTGMVDRLKAMGLISEIIAWRLRLFVPNGSQGPTVLTALLNFRYKLVRISERAAA